MTQARDDDLERFREFYSLVDAPVLTELSRAALGTSYAANSYTDHDQALRLAGLLHLDKGVTVLDIGAGAGWPGLFLAAHSGSRVVLSDVPLQGLHVASARARRDGTDAVAIAASGGRLPFRDATFDAVVHSDVLC